jgi:predicted ATPase
MLLSLSYLPAAPFVLRIGLKPGAEGDYSTSLPSISALRHRPLVLHEGVTFLVGENGSGKSTLIEALAVACGLNPEGGSAQTRFTTRASHSGLSELLELERSELKPLNGFFLRAESLFNVATAVEGLPLERVVHERPLHEQSHGESFLAVARERFGQRGLYLLDEPEAALSLTGQLALMRQIRDLVEAHCQLVIATHSPILLGYPDCRIYELGAGGIEERAYEETEQYTMTRSFLENRDTFLRHLFSD